MKRISILFYTGLLLFTTACIFTNTAKLQKSASGFEYEIIKFNSNSNLKPGDVVKLHLTQYVDDSLLNTTHNSMPEYIKIDSAATTKYDYTAILPLLNINDSAVCYFSAAQIIKTAEKDREVPGFLKKAKQIKVCIKILNSYNNDSTAAKEFLKEKAMYMAALQKKDSITMLQAALQFDSLINNETGPVTKQQNGIYVKLIKSGAGGSAALADSITIHYKSYLPNGKFLEASNPQKPLVIYKSGQFTVKGFYDIAANLSRGSIAKLFIPAMAAYGKRGNGKGVPPFSNLIIQVEIL